MTANLHVVFRYNDVLINNYITLMKLTCCISGIFVEYVFTSNLQCIFFFCILRFTAFLFQPPIFSSVLEKPKD